MGNIKFGSKYFIFSKFKSITKTSKIEATRGKLQSEYDQIVAYKKSDELKEYNELEKYLGSRDYEKKIKLLNEKKQAEHDRVNFYNKSKSSKEYQPHIKFKNSDHYKEYQAIKGSEEVAELEKMEKRMATQDYKTQKTIAEKTGKESPEVDKLEKEYAEKTSSPEIKKYIKIRDSQELKDFEAFAITKQWADFLKHEEYLNSSDHKELMESLEAQEKEENDKKQSFEDIKSSKEFKLYHDEKDSPKFKEVNKWELVFEDHFDNGELDREKWITRYFWGEKLINDAYALEPDMAFPTDGENLEFSDSSIKIVTRNEAKEGKVWKPPFGFVPQEFEFTTGLISSAGKFQQKYGKIEAKIKVNYAKPVNFNFWMASEKMLPHVDILKLDKKKSQLEMMHHYGDIADKKGPEKIAAEFTGLDLSQDYFIYTLEWTKDKLTWKINDYVVNEQKKGVPQEAMYIVFSSAMIGKNDRSGLPASMEIDWVKCYQRV